MCQIVIIYEMLENRMMLFFRLDVQKNDNLKNVRKLNVSFFNYMMCKIVLI